MFGFLKKSKKYDDIDLTNYVTKNYNTEEGIFVNIMNDLSHFKDENNLTKMSYGYARRTAGAGLYLQGILSREQFNYQQMMFNRIQLNTEHSVEFQTKAAEISNKFLYTYDTRLTPNIIGIITILALNDSFVHRQDIPQGSYIPYDELISIIQMDFRVD